MDSFPPIALIVGLISALLADIVAGLSVGVAGRSHLCVHCVGGDVPRVSLCGHIQAR